MHYQNRERGIAIRKKIFYALYLVVIVFILLEIVLRIYNPFQFRLKGDRILLPVNQSQIIHNSINAKLDTLIVNSRNSLGFRGPEKPQHFEDLLSIITVGGSTTECHFLSDDKTWPHLLGEILKDSLPGIWLNNAGFDGHSTFGHQVLLNDHLLKIKPKVILFYVGINEVENDQPSYHDKLNFRGSYFSLKQFLFTNSEVLNLALNLSRGWKAQHMHNTTHKMLDLRKGKELVLNEQEIADRLVAQRKYLAGSRKRIESLIDTCLKHSIQPVFITQPILLGEGMDSTTGVNLETYMLEDKLNGKLILEILRLYNKNTKEVCANRNVPVIDIAEVFPKDSRYFYDNSHYTNEGARKLAELIAAELRPLLTKLFFGPAAGNALNTSRFY
jgi:lysophospholipase L1-like esterase